VSISRSSRAFTYLGIAAIVFGLSKVHARYVADPPYSFTSSSRLSWAIAYVVLLALAAYGAGLPDLPRTSRAALATAAAAAGSAALGISVLQLLVGDALLPRFVVMGSALLLVPWYLLCVAVASGGRASATERDRIAVVAESSEVSTLIDDLEHGAERPAHVVAVLDPSEARPAAGADVRPLVARVRETKATVVVLSREAQADAAIVDQAAVLHESGLRIRTLSLFYEQWLGKLPLAELERMSLLFDIGEIHRARYGRMKRLVDITLGIGGVVAFVLAIPLVLIGNLLANRGPLFYTQPRVGKNGEVFEILKFRTMRPEPAGELPNEWTQEDDPRITRFGRVMRTAHIDELPQMINILRGELAVVGPRPEQPRYVAELVDKLPFYDLRHLVRPGLTGWAQVKYGYAGDESDAMEKLQYEFFYLRHQGFALDMRIIGRTVRTVVQGDGR
jgi:lipopolysaccharide/colanic/teichoic acid biosynthesis glycosyltransferase